MPPIPVVAPVRVAGPVAAQAYEDEFAMVVRPEKAKRALRAVVVTYRATTIGPRNPREYRARWIIMAIVVVEASVSVRVLEVTAVLSGNPVRTGNRPVTRRQTWAGLTVYAAA